MLVETTKGMLEEGTLTKKVTTEDIPCGWSDCTEYFLGEEMVRRDVQIRVKEGVLSEAVAGNLSLAPVAVKDFVSTQYMAALQKFTDEIGEKVQTRYPELVGMTLNFNMPGFTLTIGPKPEGA